MALVVVVTVTAVVVVVRVVVVRDVVVFCEAPPPCILTPHQRTAFIIIRWLCLLHSHEKTVLTDCLLSKLLLGDEARAHIDGIYATSYGVWSARQISPSIMCV